MRTCDQNVCQFKFEETSIGSIFREVKDDPEIAHFLIETAYMAFASNRSQDLAEPFPSFLLKEREIRPKIGNVEYVERAQAAGLE